MPRKVSKWTEKRQRQLAQGTMNITCKPHREWHSTRKPDENGPKTKKLREFFERLAKDMDISVEAVWAQLLVSMSPSVRNPAAVSQRGHFEDCGLITS